MTLAIAVSSWLWICLVGWFCCCTGLSRADEEARSLRFVHGVTSCDATHDGDSVRVHRCLGGNEKIGSKRMTLDPFLVFDAYRNDDLALFKNGFPAHPHRGFLELRYITAGTLRHNDSCGNAGITHAGDLQALFTGRGIVHEELPVVGTDTSSTCGRETDVCNKKVSFRGFQIWINVRDTNRALPPKFHIFTRHTFPVLQRQGSRGGAVRITMISGTWPGSDSTQEGPLSRAGTPMPVQTGLLLARLQMAGSPDWTSVQLPPSQHVILYAIEGSVVVGEWDEEPIEAEHLGFLGPGDDIRFACAAGGGASNVCDILFLTAPRLREGVVVSGGFVAKDKSALDAAFSDLASGQSSHC